MVDSLAWLYNAEWSALKPQSNIRQKMNSVNCVCVCIFIFIYVTCYTYNQRERGYQLESRGAWEVFEGGLLGRL